MLQKLPVNYFKLIEVNSGFDENFIKSYNEESDKGYFDTQKIYKTFKMIFHF